MYREWKYRFKYGGKTIVKIIKAFTLTMADRLAISHRDELANQLKRKVTVEGPIRGKE